MAINIAEDMDYGNGFTFRPCCRDPYCGLGDLYHDGEIIETDITQAEARRLQSKMEKPANA